MNLSYLKLFLSFVLVLLLACSNQKSPVESHQNHSTTQATAPTSWYDLSTSDESHTMDSLKQSSDEDKFGSSVETLLLAQRSAIENLGKETSQNNIFSEKNRPADWVPWRLVSIIGELGLSAGGLLGVLAFKGSAGVSVYWNKKENKPLSNEIYQESEMALLDLSEVKNKNELENELQPMIEGLMATGKISDRQNLKSQLSRIASDFHETALILSRSPEYQWYVSRFRLDLSISGTGTVSQGFSAGGALRARLEWYRSQKKITPTHSPLFANEKDRKLIGFIESLSSDLSTLSESESVGVAFDVNQFRIGLGLSIDGDFGVVKGNAQIIGHIYFKKSQLQNPTPLSENPSPLYLMVGSDAMPSHTYSNQTLMNQFDINGDGLIDESIYKLDRKVFRSGIKKAVKIGQFFGKYAQKVSNEKWKIQKLKTAFDLSVGAGFGLVTISGMVVSEIEFQNKNY